MVYHERSMHRNCTAPGWDSSYRTWRIWEHLQLEGRWGILSGYWGPYSSRSCLLESLTLLTTVIIFFIAALCLKQLGINVFGKEEFHKMFCNLSFLFMTIILKSQSAHIGRVKEQNAVKTAWKNESSHLLQGVLSHWISWILLELWPLEYFSTIILNFTDQTTCSFSKQTPKIKTNQGAQHLLHMLLGDLPCALHGSWTQNWLHLWGELPSNHRIRPFGFTARERRTSLLSTQWSQPMGLWCEQSLHKPHKHANTTGVSRTLPCLTPVPRCSLAQKYL